MEVFDEYSWLSARADHAPAVQYPAQLRLVADPVYAAGQIGFGAAVHQAAEIFCQDAAIQPQMQEIQKMYAKNQTKMNEELQKLYQREKYNPAAAACRC